MAAIAVSLQDGESKSFPSGISVAEALKELVSGKQRKQTVAVKGNGTLLDLSAPITADLVLEPISIQSETGVEILRHSTSRIVAMSFCEPRS